MVQCQSQFRNTKNMKFGKISKIVNFSKLYTYIPVSYLPHQPNTTLSCVF